MKKFLLVSGFLLSTPLASNAMMARVWSMVSKPVFRTLSHDAPAVETVLQKAAQTAVPALEKEGSVARWAFRLSGARTVQVRTAVPAVCKHLKFAAPTLARFGGYSSGALALRSFSAGGRGFRTPFGMLALAAAGVGVAAVKGEEKKDQNKSNGVVIIGGVPVYYRGGTFPSVSSLYVAALTGDVDAVRALIAHGVDLEAKDDGSHYTALQVAAWNGQIEVVRLLLAAGAEPNEAPKPYYSSDGILVASVDCSQRYPEIQALFRSAQAERELKAQRKWDATHAWLPYWARHLGVS